MGTERLRVLILAMLLLLQLDRIVNNALYNYRLVFSLDWAVSYWTFFRISLGLLVFAVAAVTVVAYGSYRKVRKESEKVVFLCEFCGNAWSEIDRKVNVRSKLPKFKILKSCPSCNKNLLDKRTDVIQTDELEPYVETSMHAETSKNNKS